MRKTLFLQIFRRDTKTRENRTGGVRRRPLRAGDLIRSVSVLIKPPNDKPECAAGFLLDFSEKTPVFAENILIILTWFTGMENMRICAVSLRKQEGKVLLNIVLVERDSCRAI